MCEVCLLGAFMDTVGEAAVQGMVCFQPDVLCKWPGRRRGLPSEESAGECSVAAWHLWDGRAPHSVCLAVVLAGESWLSIVGCSCALPPSAAAL